jgi:hypothetical protein
LRSNSNVGKKKEEMVKKEVIINTRDLRKEEKKLFFGFLEERDIYI